MANNQHFSYRHILCVACFVYTGTAAAQRTPNIQTGNQWLPAAVKIDGKLSEWDNSLLAFNRATRLEYTIANDDKDLYFAFRSKDPTAIAKIIAGGISLIVWR